MAGAVAGALSVIVTVAGRIRQNVGVRWPVSPERRLSDAVGEVSGAATLPEAVLSVLGVCVFSGMMLPAARLRPRLPIRVNYVQSSAEARGLSSEPTTERFVDAGSPSGVSSERGLHGPLLSVNEKPGFAHVKLSQEELLSSHDC